MITPTPISAAKVNALAQANNLEPALIYAVCDVESNGNGYALDGSGRLKVLFEAQQFYNQLHLHGVDPETLINKYPNLISRTWNPALYLGGNLENARLATAISINRDAAFKSASYGLFQIMGFNCAYAGFNNVEDMINFMRISHDNQLECFISYIKNTNIIGYLRNKQFALFAAKYNGPGYAQNQYDIKLQASYTKHTLSPTV